MVDENEWVDCMPQHRSSDATRKRFLDNIIEMICEIARLTGLYHLYDSLNFQQSGKDLLVFHLASDRDEFDATMTSTSRSESADELMRSLLTVD
jgi:hypothetical protein